MFSLHSIILTNFRSYRKTHKFEFPTVDGLYFLTGKNQYEPQLGSNGAGKSTLLDAICWALYGRTTRGLKSNEVLSWGLTNCQVELDLTVGKQRMKIKRTQRPISLTLNGKPVDQEEFQKHICLNYDSFKYSVLNAQFEQSFFALQPSAKLTLFSDIMELDFWLQKSDEAATLAGQQAIEIEELEKLTAKDNERLIIATDTKALKLNSDTFKNWKLSKIKDLQITKDEIQDQVARLVDSLAQLKTKKADVRSKINEFSRDIKKFTPEKDEKKEKLFHLAKQQEKHKSTIVMLKRQIENLSGIEGDCPTCLQTVDGSYLVSERELKIQELDTITAELNKINKKVKQDTPTLLAAQAVIDKKTELADELLDELKSIDTNDARNRMLIDADNVRIKDFQKQIEATKAERNPYQELLTEKEQQAKQLKAQIAKHKDVKTSLEEKHIATSFWSKGFKRIRLFIIEQAFSSLELEVNNCLAQLGMLDWQITFDIERENKSGGITKGFVVFIQSPHNTEPVRWENWSGGETQRLQLAGDLGLANLIMAQNGLSSTIEFYDEPSTHLSQEGMTDLANMLHERALNEGKRIWIVDHSAITNFGEFEGVIEIRKDSNGSHIHYT